VSGAVVVVVSAAAGEGRWWLLRDGVGGGGAGGGGGDATQWKGLFIIIKFSLLFVVVRLVVSAAVACHIFTYVVRPVVAGPRL